MAAARMLAVHMVYVRKAGIDEGSFELLGPGRLSATSAILSTPADLASCSDADLPHLQIAATA